MAGNHSYTDNLNIHAGVELNLFGATFGASTDYHYITEKTESNSNFFTQTMASCCAYTGEVMRFAPPPYSRNFEGGLRYLTEEYDEEIYLEFIDAFGTHYVKHADMGSLFGQQVEITHKVKKSNILSRKLS